MPVNGVRQAAVYWHLIVVEFCMIFRVCAGSVKYFSQNGLQGLA